MTRSLTWSRSGGRCCRCARCRRRQQPRSGAAGSSSPTTRQQARPARPGCDVERDVGGAAQALFLAVDLAPPAPAPRAKCARPRRTSSGRASRRRRRARGSPPGPLPGGRHGGAHRPDPGRCSTRPHSVWPMKMCASWMRAVSGRAHDRGVARPPAVPPSRPSRPHRDAARFARRLHGANHVARIAGGRDGDQAVAVCGQARAPGARRLRRRRSRWRCRSAPRCRSSTPVRPAAGVVHEPAGQLGRRGAGRRQQNRRCRTTSACPHRASSAPRAPPLRQPPIRSGPARRTTRRGLAGFAGITKS